MDDYYKKKYLKYKTKYLYGAGLQFNQNTSEPNKYTLVSNIKSSNTDVLEFTKSQHDTIELFFTKIIPFLSFKDKQLVADKFDVIGHGGFGVVVANDDIVIKIIKLDTQRRIDLSTLETGVMSRLRELGNGEEDYNYISKYHGFITTQPSFEQYDNTENDHFFTDIGDDADMKFIDGLHLMATLDNTILFLMSQRCGQTVGDYFDVALLSKFLHDTIAGIFFMHRAGFIHNDIKTNNIVYCGDHFQLIDFGLAQLIDQNKAVRCEHGTEAFSRRTVFARAKSRYYDWYCLFITILEIIGFIHLDVINDETCYVFNNSSSQHVIVNDYINRPSQIPKVVNALNSQNMQFKDIMTLLCASRFFQSQNDIIVRVGKDNMFAANYEVENQILFDYVVYHMKSLDKEYADVSRWCTENFSHLFNEFFK